MADSTDLLGEPVHDDDAAVTAAALEAAGQGGLFGDATPAPMQPYRVLARKYRSQTFSELIGQDAMVQTLGNAIRRGRLAHAFLMTGIRGVGKTSTARLIAKALNCIGPDGQGGPTIDPCGVCEPCRAIAEGRHIDVIEMDAASHNGVDEMRALTDATRYMAVSARYKIYIIDEVHMLSKAAFNALLKTLEEPPAHVKFLFATTDADKLPVTVLSRCQRFDLRRIEPAVLAAHFAMICTKEHVSADAEALELIAAAADGSVRDGLSILDQAISHADLAASGDGATHVSAAQVRTMLGLADQAMQRRLFAAVLAGQARAVIDEVAGQYALGIEPLALIAAQLALVHQVTLAQVMGSADAPGAEERAAISHWAGALGAGQVHRLWQLLLKAHDEVRAAPDPLAAAQMALLRVTHAADLPDPAGLVRRIEGLLRDGAGALPAVAPGDTRDAPPTALAWSDLVDRVEAVQPRVGALLRLAVRVVSLTPGHLVYQMAPGVPGDPAADISRALQAATGEPWQVALGEGPAAPSLEEARAAAAAAQAAALHDHPLVKAAFAAFPGARLIPADDQPREPGFAQSLHARH